MDGQDQEFCEVGALTRSKLVVKSGDYGADKPGYSMVLTSRGYSMVLDITFMILLLR